ncbi:hypothetical protein [Radiobacillus sp. PE A8.2]|uniref:hypothetical protein n=1 Tax=Radiobacillus sp. PE A8.2 TaxID=3380349 RepID=UPI00388F1177
MEYWLIISNFSLALATFIAAISSLVLAFKKDKPRGEVMVNSRSGNGIVYIKFRNRGRTNIYIDEIYDFFDGIKYFKFPTSHLNFPIKVEQGESVLFEFWESDLEDHCKDGVNRIFFREGTGKKFKLKYKDHKKTRQN